MSIQSKAPCLDEETKGVFLFKDKEDDEICLFLF